MDSGTDASRQEPPTQSRVRAYTASDRAAALDLVGDPRAIDDASHRIRMARNGAGLAIWLRPANGLPLLGPVLTKTPNRRLFYELVQSCAQDAIALGHRRACFVLKDRRLLSLLERDFTIDARPYGHDPATGTAVEWRVEVDLADALRQLGAALRG